MHKKNKKNPFPASSEKENLRHEKLSLSKMTQHELDGANQFCPLALQTKENKRGKTHNFWVVCRFDLERKGQDNINDDLGEGYSFVISNIWNISSSPLLPLASLNPHFPPSFLSCLASFPTHPLFFFTPVDRSVRSLLLPPLQTSSPTKKLSSISFPCSSSSSFPSVTLPATIRRRPLLPTRRI